MDLYKITEKLESKGWDLNNDFLDNNEDFLQALIDETEKAINYRCCCTQLKDKKRPTFEFWCDVNGVVNVNDCYIYKGDQVSVEYLVEKYVKETDNL
jgi:hypothetical protein